MNYGCNLLVLWAKSDEERLGQDFDVIMTEDLSTLGVLAVLNVSVLMLRLKVVLCAYALMQECLPCIILFEFGLSYPH